MDVFSRLRFEDWSRSRKRFLLLESCWIPRSRTREREGKRRKGSKVEEKLAELVSMEGKTGTRWKIWPRHDDEKEGEVGGRLMRDNKLHLSSQWSRVKPRYSGGARGQVSIYLLLPSRGHSFLPQFCRLKEQNLPFLLFLPFASLSRDRDRTISRKM